MNLTGLLHRRPKEPDPSPSITEATRKVIAMTAELNETAQRLRAAIEAREGHPR
jgi:hypothetical protein